jgi:hypothetical protein
MEWTIKASPTPLQLACYLCIKFMKKQVPSKDITRSTKILRWQIIIIWQQQKQQQIIWSHFLFKIDTPNFFILNCPTSCNPQNAFKSSISHEIIIWM